ncbi:hypothetical protein ACIRTB_06810 [Streptomyces sp. NPDC101158]|uniref:hypothetical protein n=1 Tax=Streptomyces sp. NPDC101158 TaxID=3366117 RepID=UPI00380D6C0E
MAVADNKIAAAFAHSLPGQEQETWLRRELGGYTGPIRLLLAIAVSVDWRGKGGSLADEACDRALTDAVSRSGDEPTLVVCRIELRNSASERMAERNCFEPLTEGPDEFDPEMRQWYVLAAPEDL